jgi:hypothetical protein
MTPNIKSAAFRQFALDSETWVSETIDRPPDPKFGEPNVSDFKGQQQNAAPVKSAAPIAHMPFNTMPYFPCSNRDRLKS